MGLLHDVGDLVDLVLEHQEIPGLKVLHGRIHLLPGDLLIGPAEEQDAVLSVTVSLDDGVPRLARHMGDQAHIHPRLPHHVQQKFSVALAHGSGVPDLHAALGQGDGLI